MRAEAAVAPAGGSSAAIAALHVTYARTRDQRTRDLLLAHYDDLAVGLARRFPGRREEPADLVQVARVGLILALDRFDPSRQRPFAAFATATISGELKRHIRDHTWAVKVPRGLQEHYLVVCHHRDALVQRLARDPSAAEIAVDAGLSEADVDDVMRLIGTTAFRRLDATDDGDRATDVPVEDPAFGRFETDQTVASLLTALPAAERETLRLRFGLELSQREIAGRLGGSQISISRRLQASLGGLRRRLAPEDAA